MEPDDPWNLMTTFVISLVRTRKAYFLPEGRGQQPVEEVIKAFRCREPEKRIPVLRLELDYELALLYEALVENNTHRVDQCKARLHELRKEMLQLEAL